MFPNIQPRDTYGQVQANHSQSWWNILSEDLQSKGNDRERDKPQLSGWEAVFSQGRCHLGGSAHGSYPSTQEYHIGRRRIKKGPINMTSGASQHDSCMLIDSPGPATWNLPLPLGPALSLPACCLRPATLLLLFPALLPWGIAMACNRTLLGLGGDYPCFMQFLLLSYISYCPLSLPHHPNS